MEKGAVRSFRDLEVWKRAHDLALRIYGATRNFPDEERFGITSQLRRSCASIGANIAEGFARPSTKDFLRHLDIASESLSETRYFILLSRDLTRLREKDYSELNEICDEAGRLPGGLMRSLRGELGQLMQRVFNGMRCTLNADHRTLSTRE